MSEENKTVKLKDEDLEKVGGGSGNVYEYTGACSEFKCTECGGNFSQHAVKGDSIYTNVHGYEQEEWLGHQLDCNHCQYFSRIKWNWALGNCTK